MTSISFSVAGIPKGQPRPKACVRGKHAAVYDPGTADEWKLLIRDAASKVSPPLPILSAISVRIIFFMPRPKSHFGKNGEVKSGAPFFHTSKPDADNLAKAVLDAIGTLGTFWRDDSQVSVLRVSKVYSAQASGAEVKITSEEK